MLRNGNRILAGLSPGDRTQLEPHLERVRTEPRKSLRDNVRDEYDKLLGVEAG